MHVTLSLKDGGGVEGREEENRKTYKDRKRERGRTGRQSGQLLDRVHALLHYGCSGDTGLSVVADGR